MAKMVEEIILIRLSKLVRNDEQTTEILTTESQAELEQVAQALSGSGVLVEVEKA